MPRDWREQLSHSNADWQAKGFQSKTHMRESNALQKEAKQKGWGHPDVEAKSRALGEKYSLATPKPAQPSNSAGMTHATEAHAKMAAAESKMVASSGSHVGTTDVHRDSAGGGDDYNRDDHGRFAPK